MARESEAEAERGDFETAWETGGFFHQTATGKGSGAPVEMDYAVIYELKGGQLVRMRAHAEREKALEAAGLSE